jgi:hypothetical protein
MAEKKKQTTAEQVAEHAKALAELSNQAHDEGDVYLANQTREAVKTLERQEVQ